jgi:hypothetical protein
LPCLFKWLEIAAVDYSEAKQATVIFIEFTVQFWFMFFSSPCYLNKLRNALKEFIE